MSTAKRSAEPPTSTGVLARLGFSRTDRVSRFLAEPALEGLGPGAAEALGATADGDDAVLGLLRLAEAAREAGEDALLEEFLGGIGTPGTPGHRLIRLLGLSVALGDVLARHPHRLDLLREGDDDLAVTAEAVRASLLEAVGADPTAEVPVASSGGREERDALRAAYHLRLAQIAAADACAADPAALQPRVSAAISDLADAALEAASAIARATVEEHEQVRWCVIAMGKTGARELNYISDVDVMHVVAPAHEGCTEEDVITIGAALARELARA